jgi:glycosyltransferase involved in cell wall biosynthesis
MVDLANALVEKDAEVVLIAGRLVVRETPLSAEVKIRRIAKYKRATGFLRLFTWIIGFLQILFIIKTRHRRDHLLIISNPPLATLLPLFCRNRFTFFIFDVYPDAIAQVGILSEGSVFYRSWVKANRKIFRRAEDIFTLTETMAGLLKEYSPAKEIKVVPVWSNNEFFRPVAKETNPFMAEHNLQNRFIVLYSGNLGATHDAFIIPQIAGKVKNQSILFLIIGDGDQKRDIAEAIKRLQLTNCRMLPPQPVEVIPYSFASADLAVVSLGSRASSLSLPSKTFNFMSAGLPMLCIAGEESELSRIVTKYNNGKCFSHSQVNEMAAFIDEIADNHDLLTLYRGNSLKASTDFTAANANIIADVVIKAASN